MSPVRPSCQRAISEYNRAARLSMQRVHLWGEAMPEAPPETVWLSTAAPDAVSRAVRLLQRGQVIAFPTDTVYGVGAHALLPEAVASLYRIKRRPAHLAIPLLLADAQEMARVCQDVPPTAWTLARHFWPGGLTLVLHRAPVVPGAATGGGPTVAVRVPDHSLVRHICGQLGAPLAASSANLHGQPPPVTAEGVHTAFGRGLPLLLDGGISPGGIPSTVLDLTVSPPEILRVGPVTAAQLSPYL
jgi:L-threonylcarbamoyladenylate synthase